MILFFNLNNWNVPFEFFVWETIVITVYRSVEEEGWQYFGRQNWSVYSMPRLRILDGVKEQFPCESLLCLETLVESQINLTKNNEHEVWIEIDSRCMHAKHRKRFDKGNDLTHWIINVQY